MHMMYRYSVKYIISLIKKSPEQWIFWGLSSLKFYEIKQFPERSLQTFREIEKISNSFGFVYYMYIIIDIQINYHIYKMKVFY